MSAQAIHKPKSTGAAKSPKGEASRARILKLARRILIDDGYDAFIMRDIAAQATMKLGNLQYYFPTSESLLEAVLLEQASSDIDDLRAFQTAHEDSAEEFSALVKFLVKKWRGESGKVVTIMGFLALHRPSFQKIYKDVYARFYEELGAVLKRVDPGQKPQTYKRRVQLVTALIDGAAMQIQRGSSPTFIEDVASNALQIASGGDYI